MPLARLRDQVRLPDAIYLDHALRGPLPQASLEAGQRALAQARRGSLARDTQAEAITLCRARLAQLLGWPESGLAFLQNTTHAIATLAQSIDWQPGDVVLVHADEVPANVLPWRAQGVDVQVLPSRGGRLALDDLDRALQAHRVRLVSLAAVTLPTGERRDLQAIGQRVQAAGAWFCVDVAQAAGALTLDLQHVDAIAGSTRKWLLGPPAIGFLGVRPRHLESLTPNAPGAASQTPNGDWRPTARRFEGGALPSVLFPALAASLELLLDVGVPTLERAVLARATDVATQAQQSGWTLASPVDPSARSGVIHLVHPARPSQAALLDQGLIVRQTPQGLRVSPHAWNTEEDIARLGDALRALT